VRIAAANLTASQRCLTAARTGAIRKRSCSWACHYVASMPSTDEILRDRLFLFWATTSHEEIWLYEGHMDVAMKSIYRRSAAVRRPGEARYTTHAYQILFFFLLLWAGGGADDVRSTRPASVSE